VQRQVHLANVGRDDSLETEKVRISYEELNRFAVV